MVMEIEGDRADNRARIENLLRRNAVRIAQELGDAEKRCKLLRALGL